MHDILNKNWARPELVVGNYRFLDDCNWGRYKKITGDQEENGRNTKGRQNGRRKLVENGNTEDGVIFKGERM